MKHFKRNKLASSDVEFALKDRNYYDVFTIKSNISKTIFYPIKHK